MTYRNLLITPALAAVAFLTPASAAFAEEMTAKSFVDKVSQTVISALKKTEGDFPARRQAFEDLFAQYADVPTIARFTAGAAWKKADAKTQADFVEAFKHYMAYSYAVRVSGYQKEKVLIGRVSDLGKGRLVVNTKITQSNGQPPVAVNWQLKQTDIGFKLTDLRIENISMALTQRSEFKSLLLNNNNNLSALTKTLEKRVMLAQS